MTFPFFFLKIRVTFFEFSPVSVLIFIIFFHYFHAFTSL